MDYLPTVTEAFESSEPPALIRFKAVLLRKGAPPQPTDVKKMYTLIVADEEDAYKICVHGDKCYKKLEVGKPMIVMDAIRKETFITAGTSTKLSTKGNISQNNYIVRSYIVISITLIFLLELTT